LLFAFRHPAHERSLATALRAALGDVPVAASHEVLPVFREYERTSTTTAEAYLRPVVGEYIAKIATLSERIDSLRIMTSSAERSVRSRQRGARRASRCRVRLVASSARAWSVRLWTRATC